jgi:hypothetical protein
MYYLYTCESFTSKNEKAQAIVRWFDNSYYTNYINYRKNIPKSDIVEYTDVKKILNSYKHDPDKSKDKTINNISYVVNI